MAGEDLQNDNVLVRAIVLGSDISVGEVVTAAHLFELIEPHARRANIAIDLETVLRWLVGPSGFDTSLAPIRTTVRALAVRTAWFRVANGLDADDRPTTYPRRDRRLARESMAAVETMRAQTVKTAA